MTSLTLARTVGLSVLLHVGFLIYGALQDRHPVVKFTDIDYLVFSDGARFVSEHLSPYLRATYRYTPVLAWLVVPNVLVHPLWGKLLFCACDLVAGWVMHKMLVARGMQDARAARYAAVWLLNPFVVAISTRGNAESVVSVLVVTTLWALVARRRRLAAILFGTSVHFKVFPIIYALAIWLMLQAGHAAKLAPVGKTGKTKPRPAKDLSAHIRSFFSPVRLEFGVLSAAVFFALSGAMYYIYGTEFLHETYLYHVTRKDHRHNFSLYFYQMYLSSVLPASAQGAAAGVLSAILSFLPQLGLVSVLGAVLAKDIAFACFAQTFAFVMLNKVCTSQYFMWYICFLPVILPSSRLCGDKWKHGLALLVLWVAAQALWLSQAYRLEHLGHNTFRELWAASAAFYLVNAVILAAFVRYHRFEPVFNEAGGVRQVYGGKLRQRQAAGPAAKPPRIPSQRSKDPLPPVQLEETNPRASSPRRSGSPTSTSPSRKDEPPPVPELTLQETHLGRGLVRFTVKYNKPSGGITALDVLAGVCGAAPFVQYMYNETLPALHISLLLLLFSALRAASRMQAVRHESITFMQSFGITLEQATAVGKKQTFIPLTDVVDVVINEAITRWTIKYYLAIIVKDKPELVVVFEHFMPRLAMLTPVRRAGQNVLWPSVAKDDVSVTS
ncbi:GPI mannosyltransferase 1 [Geranomyces variabilis]|nr:GPI mannosyltransferase 1 [Geranomyces variabilis]